MIEFIGRLPISRTEDTRHFYELEDELAASVNRTAEELKRLMSIDIPEDELRAFCLGEVLFGLLDKFRPSSIPASTAFLQRYSSEAHGASGEQP